ncbi:hypothetical protein JKJ11_01000 [Vibrio sp. SCSIO 43133]|uniref:hypothetical protein n=1 Tax=Vibrio sp. SCSIO 43133 TaxID=2802577 RepID=UPI0020750214|nr:hypothetical protein [Vibrio sp. SCSIO 43133]USE00699.1 hypothetical protein JKJ11_01000 [Vibrio sp. SCSIO 43133]
MSKPFKFYDVVNGKPRKPTQKTYSDAKANEAAKAFGDFAKELRDHMKLESIKQKEL